MTPGDAFLHELKERTTAHLEALAAESADAFGRFVALPELGPRIYHRLVVQFQMDGAQTIAAALVTLFAGGMDDGTVMVTELEFRGMRAVLDEFGDDLPEGPGTTLRDLIATLSRADKRGT